jgi:hypothetical protein
LTKAVEIPRAFAVSSMLKLFHVTQHENFTVNLAERAERFAQLLADFFAFEALPKEFRANRRSREACTCRP